MSLFLCIVLIKLFLWLRLAIFNSGLISVQKGAVSFTGLHR